MRKIIFFLFFIFLSTSVFSAWKYNTFTRTFDYYESYSTEITATSNSDSSFINALTVSLGFDSDTQVNNRVSKGLYNEITCTGNSDSSNVFIYGVQNNIDVGALTHTGSKNAHISGVYNNFWTSAGGVNSVIGIDNFFMHGCTMGGYGVRSTMCTLLDTIAQSVTGDEIRLLTQDAADVAYGVHITDTSDSAGGTQYGLFVDLDDASVNNYSIYVETGSGPSYFGSNTDLGLT